MGGSVKHKCTICKTEPTFNKYRTVCIKCKKQPKMNPKMVRALVGRL